MTIGVAACSGEVISIQRWPILPRRLRDHRIELGDAGRARRPSGEPAASAAIIATLRRPYSGSASAAVGAGVAGRGQGHDLVQPRARRVRTRRTGPEIDRLGGTGVQAGSKLALELGRRHPRYRRARGQPSIRSRAAMAFRHAPSSRPTISLRQATIHPGQQLVIPRYSPSPVATARAATVARPLSAHRPAPSAAMSPAGNPGVHVVAPGRDAEQDFAPLWQAVSEIAKANNIQVERQLKIGDRLVIPGVRTSAAKPKDASSPTPVSRRRSRRRPRRRKRPSRCQSASVFTPVAESPPAKTLRSRRRQPARCRNSAGRRTAA